MNVISDRRIILTLDAGGTNFVFNALRGGRPLLEPIIQPSYGYDLNKSLSSIKDGFYKVIHQLTEDVTAISFAFPGPADYPQGVIGDLPNFPAYKGGIALGAMLEEEFDVPVFIQNDGNLFALGEAIGGALPMINAKSKKQYKNLIGLTLGTGVGAGLIHNGELIIGDTCCAGEVWITSNSVTPSSNVEEGISTRAIVRNYFKYSRTSIDNTLMPYDIYKIALEEKEGVKDAAIKSFVDFGTHLGDLICNLIAILDGVVVIGGGLTGARKFYMPALLDVVRGKFECGQSRAIQNIYCLDNSDEEVDFFRDENQEIEIPFSNKKIRYSTKTKLAIVTSKLNASEAIALGAYAHGLKKLDSK